MSVHFQSSILLACVVWAAVVLAPQPVFSYEGSPETRQQIRDGWLANSAQMQSLDLKWRETFDLLKDIEYSKALTANRYLWATNSDANIAITQPK